MRERERSTDPEAWVQRAVERAEMLGLTAYEIRADLQEDLRFVRRKGQLTTAAHKHVEGIGVRVFTEGASAYAHTTIFDDRAIATMLEQAVRLATANARLGHRSAAPRLGAARRIHYRADVRGDPLERIDEVPEILRRAEDAALAARPSVAAQVGFGVKRTRNILALSSGSWLDTTYLHSTLLAQAVARDGGRIGGGDAWMGGERGLDDYHGDAAPEVLGAEAAHQAVEQLDAVAAPVGRVRALCDPRLTGLMVHESFGHLTEYDLIAPGWSVLKDRLGESLAMPGVTIRDSPIVPGERDQGVVVPYDQEGTEGATVTLVQNGVLSHYLHARDDARETDSAPTGNGRALGVGHPPIVRMRNTYLEPGDLSHEEALAMVGDGVYLIGGRGGSPQCDGSFMFSAMRGYLVERGETTRPIRTVSLYGNVLDFLARIQGMTRERFVDTNYFGGCGKWDQSYLHVGMGGPHVVVEEALLGGRSA